MQSRHYVFPIWQSMKANGFPHRFISMRKLRDVLVSEISWNHESGWKTIRRFDHLRFHQAFVHNISLFHKCLHLLNAEKFLERPLLVVSFHFLFEAVMGQRNDFNSPATPPNRFRKQPSFNNRMHWTRFHRFSNKRPLAILASVKRPNDRFLWDKRTSLVRVSEWLSESTIFWKVETYSIFIFV